MVDKSKVIEVTNRDSGRIGYSIPDLGNLRRSFAPGETKKITYEELEKLSWIPGGKKILRDYLIINDREATDELLGDVNPEYYYTEKEVKELLTHGTLEQLQDTLEFAPDGVIDMIKKEAVELPVNNVEMRKEIFKATNFNVDKAIEINSLSEEKDEDDDAETKKRRANPITVTKTSSERKSTPIIIQK